MARPKNCRKIAALPGCVLFKPAGVPARTLSEVRLSVDEFEAIRLADRQGLYQQDAAAQMGVSRQTFGRIVDSARKKVATALVEGLALRIEGGEVELAEARAFLCADCQHAWQEPYGTGRPAACPACGGLHIRRAESDVERGEERPRRGRRGRCGGGGCPPGGGRGAGRGQGGRRGQEPS